MKKILKYALYGFLGFMVIGIIITFIFAPSEEELKIINKEKKEKNLNQYNTSVNKFLEEKNFIQANIMLGKIVDSDSLNTNISFLRKEISSQYKSASKTIKKELSVLKSKMNFKKDEFKSLTWIEAKYKKGSYGNRIYCYFSKDSKGVSSPRLVIRYYGNDWIFWNKVTFLVDGQSFIYYPNKTPKHDNNTSVWETTDEVLSEQMKTIIGKMFNAKTVKYRLEGKYIKDLTLSKRNIKAIKEVLKYNYLLKNSSKIINFKLN